MALSVKAIGLATSLGGWVQASAACRAGLARPAPAPDVEVMAPGDEAPEAVHAHGLFSATFGFSGAGRLVALVAEALVDLRAQADMGAGALGPDTLVVLALPDPGTRGIGLELFPEYDELPDPGRARTLAERIVSLAGPVAGLSISSAALQVVPGEHAAFAGALATAEAALAARRARAVLVCAVDSLASPEALERFMGEERVKTGEVPTGFAPGEAAAAFLLEADRGEGARLGPVATAREPVAFGTDRVADGRALADCVVRASGAPAPGLWITDEDGETHRARELGCARVLLMSKGEALAETPAWTPAMSFGNTGAASGALGAALAVRGLERGYAGAGPMLVLSSEDGGARAAVRVEAGSGKRGGVRWG